MVLVILMKNLQTVSVLIILLGLLLAGTTTVLLFNNSKSQPKSTSQPSITKPLYKVSLSINDAQPLEVQIDENKNHCDVLKKAEKEGKIKNLNMKWSESFKTDSVYQINGIGKPDQVWWVYTINDQEVTSGCSHVKVKNNDKVNWKYLGKD